MKYSLNIIVEAESFASVETRVLDALGTGTEISGIFARPEVIEAAPTVTVSSADPVIIEEVVDAAKAEIDPPAEPVEEELTPAQKAARTRKKNKEAAEAKAKAEAEAAGEAGDPPAETPPAAAPKVTESGLKKAVKSAIESIGVNGVRDIFKDFDGKNDEPCMKLSDVKERDYGKVVAALEAAEAEA